MFRTPNAVSHAHRAAVHATVLAAFALLPVAPVRAQGYTPVYTVDFGNPTVLSEEANLSRRSDFNARVSLGVFPLVTFLRSGVLAGTGTSGTGEINGSLYAADLALFFSQKAPTLDLGGWYFVKYGHELRRTDSSDGKQDLWEAHARLFASPRRDIGFQVAALSSTAKVSPGKQYTLYFVSEYASSRLRKRSKTPWALQGGIGTFINPLYDPDFGRKHTTYGFSFFLSGSVSVGKRFNITLSEWYIRDRSADVNRLAFGLGYNF